MLEGGCVPPPSPDMVSPKVDKEYVQNVGTSARDSLHWVESRVKELSGYLHDKKLGPKVRDAVWEELGVTYLVLERLRTLLRSIQR